jgi:hypothetical protein
MSANGGRDLLSPPTSMPAEPSNSGSPSSPKLDDRIGSDKVKMDDLQERERAFAVVESTNRTLSAEVARLKRQVEAARGQLRIIWDFIFQLKAKHVMELARLEAEHSASGLPKLRAALADLRRQNNAIRLENAELGRAWERMSAELAKRKAETSQLARERDVVRSMIARRLTSKLWLLKNLLHL